MVVCNKGFGIGILPYPSRRWLNFEAIAFMSDAGV